jgi:flagellar M-ring protein FliF
MDFFRRLAQQVRDVWAGMSAAARVLFVAVAVLLVALIAGFFYYRAQPGWAVLYSNLTAEDSQAIQDKLQAQGVPVKVSFDGHTVEVPRERVGTVRIDLAAQGLPAQPETYKLFDEPSLGATSTREHVTLLRAKQGVIARMIRQVEPVANATVEISQAEPSPFIRDKQPTTASVIVQLKPNATLSRKQVEGIVALVSKAVEGLTADNVSVVDGKGIRLSEPGGPEAGVVSSQLDYRRAVESYLAEKAQAILIPSLGAGRAVVKVTADINFQRLKEVRDTINPEQKALKSERTTSSKTQSSGGGARGLAGAASNLALRQPNAAAAAGGGGISTSTQEESEATFDYSRTHSELEDRLGNISRLTVAATVDLTAPEGGKAPLTKEAVEGLIKQALGFDVSRGDTIEVAEAKLTPTVAPPMPTEPAERTELEWWQHAQVALLVRYGPWIIAVLALLVFGWVLIRALRPAAAPPPAAVAAAERERTAARLAEAAQRDPAALARAIAALMERP